LWDEKPLQNPCLPSSFEGEGFSLKRIKKER
jgi:hypothetical protein